jgi:hypothetical protein
MNEIDPNRRVLAMLGARGKAVAKTAAAEFRYEISPLIRAGEGIRTLDVNLGKVTTGS